MVKKKVSTPKFAFYQSRKKAVKVGEELNRPVFKAKTGYFVGNPLQAGLRVNLKHILVGKAKKLIIKRRGK